MFPGFLNNSLCLQIYKPSMLSTEITWSFPASEQQLSSTSVIYSLFAIKTSRFCGVQILMIFKHSSLPIWCHWSLSIPPENKKTEFFNVLRSREKKPVAWKKIFLKFHEKRLWLSSIKTTLWTSSQQRFTY